MKKFRFTWDPAKAKLNAKKHGVSFEEAQTIFAMTTPGSSTIPIILRTRTDSSSWA
jgi:uncharacterized DUF497 family protein